MTSKFVRCLSSMGLVLALTACSQALVIEKGQLAKAEEVQCTRVTRTGSYMVKRVCTTRSEREAQSALAQSVMQRAVEQQRAERMGARSERMPSPSRP